MRDPQLGSRGCSVCELDDAAEGSARADPDFSFRDAGDYAYAHSQHFRIAELVYVHNAGTCSLSHKALNVRKGSLADVECGPP